MSRGRRASDALSPSVRVKGYLDLKADLSSSNWVPKSSLGSATTALCGQTFLHRYVSAPGAAPEPNRRSSARRIFPVNVLGSVSTKSICRG
jgi:hypothetical protein